MKNINKLYVTARVTQPIESNMSKSGRTCYVHLCIDNLKSKHPMYIQAKALVSITPEIKTVKKGDVLRLCLAVKTDDFIAKSTNRLRRKPTYMIREMNVTGKHVENIGHLAGYITDMRLGRTSGTVVICTNSKLSTQTILQVNRKKALASLRNFQVADWINVNYSLHNSVNVNNQYTHNVHLDSVNYGHNLNK